MSWLRNGLRCGDRRRLPGGTGLVNRPRDIDNRQGNMRSEYRTHATQDQNRRVLEKLDRSTTPESVMNKV